MLCGRIQSNQYFQPIKGQSSPKVSKNRQDIKSSSSSPKTKSILSGSNFTSPRRVSSPIGSFKNVSTRESKSPKTSSSPKWTGNFILMVELRRKMFTFRDIIDLPPLDGSPSITDMVIHTMKDLQKLCPEIIHSSHILEIRRANVDKVLDHFFNALKSIGDSWIDNPEWIAKSKYWSSSVGKNKFDRLVEQVIAALDGLSKMSKERFDTMESDEEEEEKKELTSPRKAKTLSSQVESLSESFSDSRNSFCGSPISVLPEPMMGSPGKFGDFANCASHLLLNMRAQALDKLSPIDVKRLAMQILSQKEAQKPNQSNLETEINVVEEIKQKMDETNSIDVEMETEESVVLDKETDTNMKISSLDSTYEPRLNLSENTETRSIDVKMENKQNIDETRSIDVKMENKQKIDETKSIDVKMEIKPNMDETMSIDVKMETEESVVLDEKKDTIMKISSLNSTSESKLNLSEKTENATEFSSPPSMRLARGGLEGKPPKLDGLANGAAAPPPPMANGATGPSPPPPRMGIENEAAQKLPPPPMANGAAGPSLPQPRTGMAPPPPPRILLPKKPLTKLKRSTQLANIYRILKGKVEGRDPAVKTGGGSGRKVGGGSTPAGGKQGMTEALAEIAKKSPYYQQVQADIAKYMKSVNELKIEITKFQTKDMKVLLSFHRRVESVLENLTDESQVLARCEGFPQKKLEAIRMAAALYLKLHGMITELQNWKIEPPLNQLLDKVERYFTKIKGDIDTLDRTKDEEAKRFKSHNIHFDFNIIIKIKEAMVDISSNCMELALKEKRDEKLVSPDEKPSLKKTVGCADPVMWRSFQFAFKVYTFAGGHDDRADSLTKELAHEIQTDSENP